MARRPLARSFDLAGSLATTFLRGGAGIATTPLSRRPEWLFELYEFEGCPFCRLVREVLTELDLDTIIRPCPKGGERFRPAVETAGGRAQFPWFVDPNTGVRLYESQDIVTYLFDQYGGGQALPLRWRLPALQTFGATVAGLSRGAAGTRVRPSRAPDRLLELYAFEGSPFARLVRERLCELELPYVLRACGRSTLEDWVPPPVREALDLHLEPRTLNRRLLLERAGRISIPYLVDPNTGAEMGDSAFILEYLDDTYAL
ncbi:MAG: glutathione S-transferase N-terminal domain-containing protein [Pseudomonadales bacterium]|jgi:glutathione S-transferase|nr:glutathione S-transferase N-terminal domain-containing protein [Pseudomonadales bacterium]